MQPDGSRDVGRERSGALCRSRELAPGDRRRLLQQQRDGDGDDGSDNGSGGDGGDGGDGSDGSDCSGDGDGGDGDGEGDEGGVGAGRLRALDPLLADALGYRLVRCGGGGSGRQVSLDAHRRGCPSFLYTMIVETCTAST